MKKEPANNHLQLEQRIASIESRNKKVEADKAWEISWARRLSIGALTYLVVAIFLIAINKPQPFINAFVPPIGFLLSTLVMGGIRDLWQSNRKTRVK